MIELIYSQFRADGKKTTMITVKHEQEIVHVHQNS